MNNVVKEALGIMGVGMATVFTVLLIFYLLVKGLNKLFPYKGD